MIPQHMFRDIFTEVEFAPTPSFFRPYSSRQAPSLIPGVADFEAPVLGLRLEVSTENRRKTGVVRLVVCGICEEPDCIYSYLVDEDGNGLFLDNAVRPAPSASGYVNR